MHFGSHDWPRLKAQEFLDVSHQTPCKPKGGVASKAKDRKKGEANERGKRQQNGQKSTIRAGNW